MSWPLIAALEARNLGRSSASALRTRPVAMIGPVLLLLVAVAWNVQAILFLDDAFGALDGTQRASLARLTVVGLVALWAMIALVSATVIAAESGPLAYVAAARQVSAVGRGAARVASRLVLVLVLCIGITLVPGVIVADALPGSTAAGLVALEAAFVRSAVLVIVAAHVAGSVARKRWGVGVDAMAATVAAALVVVGILAPALVWPGRDAALAAAAPALALIASAGWPAAAGEVLLLAIIGVGGLLTVGAVSDVGELHRGSRCSTRPVWVWTRAPVLGAYGSGMRHPLALAAGVLALAIAAGAALMRAGGRADRSAVWSLGYVAVVVAAMGVDPMRQEFGKVALLPAAQRYGSRAVAGWAVVGTAICALVLGGACRLLILPIVPLDASFEWAWLGAVLLLVLAVELAALVGGERPNVTSGRSLGVFLGWMALSWGSERALGPAAGGPYGVVLPAWSILGVALIRAWGRY